MPPWTRFQADFRLVANGGAPTPATCRLIANQPNGAQEQLAVSGVANDDVAHVDTAVSNPWAHYTGAGDYRNATAYELALFSEQAIGRSVTWHGDLYWTDAAGTLHQTFEQTGIGGIASPARFGPFPIAGPIVYCQYGYRIKPGMPGAQILNDIVFNAAFALIPNAWWAAALGPFIGQVVDNNVLCASGPPTITSISTSILINPARGALELLYATLWPYFCECAPGAATPTPPPLPQPPKPTDWPSDPTYPVNPTDPCLDLTEVRRKLDEILRVTGNDLALDRIMQRWSVPFATIDGAVWGPLTGEGTFTVERAIGFRVELVQGSGSATLDSEPDYYWNVGWMSLSDGDGMLQQRRIARRRTHWFPDHAQLGTVFGYHLEAGQAIVVTVLLPEP